MRLALTALSLALLTTGCDPVGEVRFVVVDTAGAPIPDANVVIACPGYPDPSREQSGPDGRVVYTHIPDIDPYCTFTIEKPGFVTRSLKRADVGYRQGIDDKAPPANVVLDRAPTPPAPTAAPSAAPEAAGAGAAARFAGPPPDDVKLAAGYGQFDGTRLMIRKPIGWTLVTDRTAGFLLSSPDGTAKLLVGEVKTGSALTGPPVDLLAYAAAKDVKVQPPVKGTIGKFALPAQIGEGTARIADQKDPGRIFYFQIEAGGPNDITAIAVLRAGVKPENEKALIAAIQSIKQPSDK